MRKFQFEGKNNVSGDRIRELRLRARLSQATLAAKMQTEGALIEQDAISRIFSVSADWLIGADRQAPQG